MPTRQSPAKVLVVDAHEFRRAGLVEYLKPWSASQGLQVVSSSPAEGLELLEGEHPCRLLVLSIGAGSIFEKETQKQLKILRAIGGDFPIVVVSDSEEADEIVAAIDLGVQGFLPTTIKPELAVQALSFIVSGGSYFPSSAIRQLQQMAHKPETPPRGGGLRIDNGDSRASERGDGEPSNDKKATDETERCGPEMTNRQREVLNHLCLGEQNKAIGRKLGMTEATVKVHVRQIMRKLGATNRTQAALSAVDYERQDVSHVGAVPHDLAAHREQRIQAAE
jgi:DNA-binding NarL/FixJ family response regulator